MGSGVLLFLLFIKFVSIFKIMSTKLLQSYFASFFDLWKEYNSCLILFFSFSELFPAFNWAKEIGNLLSIWLGVNIFSPCPYCCLLISRIFSRRFTISSAFSICFFCSPMSSISSFKSLNPLLIKPNWILFFLGSFFDLHNFSNKPSRSWTKKCFLTNSSFMSLVFA